MPNVRIWLWEVRDRGVLQRDSLITGRLEEERPLADPIILDEYANIVLTDGVGNTDDSIRIDLVGNYLPIFIPTERIEANNLTDREVADGIVLPITGLPPKPTGALPSFVPPSGLVDEAIQGAIERLRESEDFSSGKITPWDLRPQLADAFTIPDNTDAFGPTFRGPVGGQFVCAVGVNNRLFGIYDIQSIKVRGEFPITTLTGKVDRQFEDTLYNIYGELWDEILTGVIPAQPRAVYTFTIDPYRTWGARYKNMLQVSTAQATNFGSIRSNFHRFALGISPLSYLKGGFTVVRDIEIYPLYPVDRLQRFTYPNHVVDSAEGLIIQEEPYLFHHYVELPDEWILEEPEKNLDFPDFYNKPGSWLARRIDIAVRSLQLDSTIYSSGSDFPRVILDISAQEDIDSEIYIQLKRWELQNTSAKASLTILGNVNFIPRQLVRIPARKFGYRDWRIESVKHTLNPDNQGFTTTLDLVLYQGFWQLDQQAFIIPFGNEP